MAKNFENGLTACNTILKEDEEIKTFGESLTSADYDFKYTSFGAGTKGYNNLSSYFSDYRDSPWQKRILYNFILSMVFSNYATMTDIRFVKKQMKFGIFALFFAKAMELGVGKYTNSEFITPNDEHYKITDFPQNPRIIINGTSAQSRIYFKDSNTGKTRLCSIEASCQNDSPDLHNLTAMKVNVNFTTMFSANVEFKEAGAPFREINKNYISKLL